MAKDYYKLQQLQQLGHDTLQKFRNNLLFIPFLDSHI